MRLRDRARVGQPDRLRDRARAAARDASGRYPGERLANDPWLALMERAAVQHWRERGVQVPSVPIDVASDLRDSDGADATGRGGDGRVVVSDAYVAQMLNRARSRRRTTRDRRQAFQRLGEVIAHEYGHVGLGGGTADHTPNGLMAPYLDESQAAVPWEIVHLSRRLIRRDPARDARLRARMPQQGRVAGGGFRVAG